MKNFSSILKTAGVTFLTACFLNAHVQAAPAKIPADAVEWRGHSYKIFDQSMAWADAERFCENLGGHLVAISSADEQNFINSLIVRGKKSCYWAGGSLENGIWKWVTGEFIGYTNWAKGEPNGGIYEPKIILYRETDPRNNSRLGEWNDNNEIGAQGWTGLNSIYNQSSFGFVCEWDKSKQNDSIGQAVNRVTVEGTGANRDSAIRDAARYAVEQVVGVYVDVRSLSKNSILALDEIYTKAQGYVKNVTVINESYSGGNCNVTANIEVDNNPDGQLMNQLSMIMMLNDPRISVIVLKENTSPIEHDNISETAMNERLIDLGFSHVVDANIVSNLQNAELLNNIYNGKSSLSGVGDSYGTDYLVLGKSLVDIIPASGANMGKAELSVKIIKFDTGDIIGTFTVEGQGAEKIAAYAERRSLKAASSEAAKKLEEKFKKLSSTPMQSMQITVKTSKYDNIEQLVKELKSVHGVQNINVREYRNGRAILDIESSQNPSSLLQILKKSTTLKFSVEEISAAGMKIVIS